MAAERDLSRAQKDREGQTVGMCMGGALLEALARTFGPVSGIAIIN